MIVKPLAGYPSLHAEDANWCRSEEAGKGYRAVVLAGILLALLVLPTAKLKVGSGGIEVEPVAPWGLATV
jgi:hypothetical protein